VGWRFGGVEHRVSVVHTAISTAADASRTTNGSSHLAELARLGQMAGDSASELARRAMTDGFYPGSWVEARAVIAALRQDHDILTWVVEIDDGHHVPAGAVHPRSDWTIPLGPFGPWHARRAPPARS